MPSEETAKDPEDPSTSDRKTTLLHVDTNCAIQLGLEADRIE